MARQWNCSGLVLWVQRVQVVQAEVRVEGGQGHPSALSQLRPVSP